MLNHQFPALFCIHYIPVTDLAWIVCTVTIEQWTLIKHCLWTTHSMTTHSKIVDPLYILLENMQFDILCDIQKNHMGCSARRNCAYAGGSSAMSADDSSPVFTILIMGSLFYSHCASAVWLSICAANGEKEIGYAKVAEEPPKNVIVRPCQCSAV
jgi:hypothetical protein